MNFQQLRYFRTVYECKNITKASERLQISQPAVSTAVKELEIELGVQLFLRQNRGLIATEEGDIFYASACKMLAQCENARDMVREASERRFRVRLGMAPMAGNVVFPKIYQHLAEQCPEVELEIIEDGSYELKKQLEEDQVEVILITDRMEYPDLEKCEIYRSRIVFAIREDHPLAQLQELDVSQLAGVPLAIFRKGYAMNRQICDMLQDHGVTPKIMAETSSFVTIKSLIECGAAGGFLMKEVCEDQPQLRVFELPQLASFPIYLAWKKGGYQSKVVRQFIKSCRELQMI